MKCIPCGLHDYMWNIEAHQKETGHVGIAYSDPKNDPRSNEEEP